ncbi:MAG TPA: alpha/beta hydrolase [Tianweitania sediminis]|jgi:pimeloyl-ACP methyl ester carboxylesterase|nr:alpha/beta hydrolase [Tianweitania sediminis]
MNAVVSPRPRPADTHSPLLSYGGQKPPAPAWFAQALANEPEALFLDIDGSSIEVLRWGTATAKAPLLLLHGNGASADWWRFIAPFLSQDRQVVACSWPGMGHSDWRDHYAIDDFVQLADAVAEQAGLLQAKVPPVLVGHSYGGMVTCLSAARAVVPWSAAVIIDSLLVDFHSRQGWDVLGDPARAASQTWPKANIFGSLEEALTRFRFLPPQPSVSDYVTDFIARSALKPVGDAWTWRTDPKLRFLGIQDGRLDEALPRIKSPLTLIRGELSALVSAKGMETMAAVAPAETRFIAVPEAYHHVPVDQPLALVAALRAVL